MVIRGELERVGRGLYRLPSAPITESHTLALVAQRVPRAVVGLLSALQYYQLTTELPAEVWVLVPSRARTPSIDYPPLRVVRASGVAITHGVAKVMVEGTEVRLTTPAKTVADCFRYRRLVGLDTAIEALRDYLRPRPRRGDIGELLEAARATRITSVITPYLEALS
jgi:predicted transcriptional regulator of viral defense system